jgi:hypothetical protein
MKPVQTVIEIVPAGASEEGAGAGTGGLALTRRQALTWMAASAALAGAGCSRPPQEQVHPFVRMPEAGLGGEALYYASSFVRNGFAHGVLVGTREGRPIKIEGNPLHPASLGRTDVFAQASVLQLWDPERSQTVRQREKAGASALPSTWRAFDTAWQQRAAALRTREGAGLRVLTGCVTSPTLQAQLAALQARFPKAVLHRHDPLFAANAWQGTALAFGQPLRLRHDAAQASLIVALDADPFSHGPASVRFAADWARARGEAAPRQAARLVALETTPGLFGARADERLALPPDAIEALVARVAVRCGLEAAQDNDAHADPATAAFEARLADALRAAGAGALLVAGESLSPRTHALVCALHQHLGAWGRTVQAIAPPEGTQAQPLGALLDAIGRDEVDTLLVLDTNPAYDAPGELGVAQALARVRFSAFTRASGDDETARCLPTGTCRSAHAYEQWSDARAHRRQRPRSCSPPSRRCTTRARRTSCVASAARARTVRDGRALVQPAVARRWGSDDFDTRSGARACAPASCDEQCAGAAGGGHRAAVPARSPRKAQPRHPHWPPCFPTDASVHDGRFANSAWLQELPRPLTQASPGPTPLLLGPRTAAAAGCAAATRAAAPPSARSSMRPCGCQPLHAEGAVTLPLGYGSRRNAGPVGNGVGFDAYARAARATRDAAAAAAAARGPDRIEFARTQNNDRPLRAASSARSVRGRRIRRAARRGVAASLYPALDASASTPGRWPSTSTPASAATRARSRARPRTTSRWWASDQVARGRVMHWIRVDRYETSTSWRARTAARQHVPAGALHALREGAVRDRLPGGRHDARQRGPQRAGLQPLRGHALLLQQLPVQGAALQLPAVQRHAHRIAQGAAQPRGDGARRAA